MWLGAISQATAPPTTTTTAVTASQMRAPASITTQPITRTGSVSDSMSG